MKRISIIAVMFCGLAAGQSKPAAVPPAPAAAPVKAPAKVPPDAPNVLRDQGAPVTAEEPSSYPLPLEDRDQFRDRQHENDQIEIDNQKMLVKLEQNKARQAAIVDEERLIAFRFAQAKHINLDLYELDPGPIWFVRKKTK